MKLLGAYSSRISVFHYQELLKLLEAGLVLGDFGGGALFDKAAADILIQQGQDFSSLPAISAGSRAIADSVNTPLSTLNARYAAIGAERDDFLARMDQFLSVLGQDSDAIDRLLYAAEMETWMVSRPQLSSATQFGYDFSSTHGQVPSDVSMVDPTTGVRCLDADGLDRQPIDVSFLVDGKLVRGIGAPIVSVDRTLPINLVWSESTRGTEETLSGPDWTQYTLLAPAPLLTFKAPSAAVILPKSHSGEQILEVRGQQVAGNLPVYVKIVFVPRRRKVVISQCVDKAAQSLSAYRISPDDIIVYDAAQSYEQDQDFQIDLTAGRSDIVPRAALAGKIVNVQVTEYFPGYQCSTNNMDWSPAVMFDAATPFSDVRTSYFPIEITADGYFPVVDELGLPLGIEIRPKAGLNYEALLRIETNANDDFGVTTRLEIEFDRPGYYNGLRLTPFVNMPVCLTQIQSEGMLTLGAAPDIFYGNVLIDRPVSIRFADSKGNPVFVRRLFLTLYQPNYSLTEQLVSPSDQLRQESLARLQTVLPFSDRPVQPSLPTSLVGAQYNFGLRDIAGERYNPIYPPSMLTPTPAQGVFVSGPFHIDGMPEIIRKDAEVSGSVDCYLICRPAGAGPSGDVIVAQLKGDAISFLDAWGGATFASCDLYLKWVFRSDDAVLTRFLLQVTKGA